MSIATRIEAIEQHITDDYSVLELAGADLTNVDKNIENLKQSWEERLLYFLANGTDVVWNNWLPKVNGTGESITLNNTIEAKMDFVYKGNTYQYSTTGKNLCYFSNFTEYGVNFNGSEINVGNTNGDVVYVGSNFNLQDDTSKSGKTYTIYACVNGTKQTGSSGTGLSINFAKTGVPVAFQVGLASSEGSFNNRIYVGTITLGENEVFRNVSVVTNNAITANINVKVMIVEGSYTAQTIGDYEPYTNGASPNPDYPQDIQVVSGDNEINVVGKNLVNDYDLVNRYNIASISDNIITTNALNSNYTVFQPRTKTQKIDLVENTKYYVSFDCRLKSGTYSAKLGASIINGIDGTSYSTGNTAISNPNMSSSYQRYSFECISNITTNSILGFSIQVQQGLSNAVFEIKNIMISTSSDTTYEPYQSQSYPINLGNIELCKIGDYQDKIAKSSGKNLFDKDSVVKVDNKILNDSGVETNDNTGGYTKMYIPVEPNTTYTISGLQTSGTKRIYFFDNSKGFISRTSSQYNVSSFNFTTPNNCYYIDIQYYLINNNFNTYQIEKGNQATQYEPYGKVWYLNKQIGKVVFNGSENWQGGSSSSGNVDYTYFYTEDYDNSILPNSLNSYCDKLTSLVGTAMVASTFVNTDTISIGTNSTNRIRLMFLTNRLSEQSTTAFKTWLSAHNTIVYYALATPTTTEITDTTLISQLEALKKSYNTQTNISQTNADKPFILDVVALGE